MSWFKSMFGKQDENSKMPPEMKKTTPKQMNTATQQPVEMLPIEDIDYMYRKMEELPVVIPEEGMSQPKGTVESKGVTHPKGTTKLEGTSLDKDTAKIPKFQKYTPPIIRKDTKLTIILVENTEAVLKEKDKLEQVKRLVTSGKVCVINYGKIVRQGMIVEAKEFNCSDLLCEEFADENACLYDALIALEGVVDENHKKVEEIKNTRVRIKEIEIIGIGRCFDNCSINSSQLAIESFGRVAKRSNITIKYICLTEESFVQAATIGFHSIISMSRNYM